MIKKNFILFFFICQGIFSQTDFKRDSLIIAKNKTKAIQHINPRPDSALFYIKENIRLSESIDYDIGIADAEYFLAQYYRRVQKLDSAIVFFERSALRSGRSGHSIGASIANNGLCRTLYLLGRYEEAEKACNNALEPLDNKTLDTGLGYMTKADTHTALGTIHSRKNNIEQAQKNFFIVDSMHQNKKLRPDVIAAAYQNLGGIYLGLKDLKLAEDYYNKANNEFEKLPPKAAEFYLNSNNVELGKLQLEKEDFIKADSLLSNCYAFFKKIGEEQILSEVAATLALIKIKKNDFKKADGLLNEAYQIHTKNGLVLEAASDAVQLARLSIKKEAFKTAMNWANKAGKLNEVTKNSIIKRDRSLILSKLYARLKNYKKAYVHKTIGTTINDSLQKVQSAEAIREVDEKYRSEKQDREIKLLKADSEVIKEQTKNRQNLLLGGIGLTSLAGIFLLVLYKNRLRTNKKLREVDVLKNNFFTNISHEFRTPLTLISTPIQQSLQEPDLPAEKRKHLEIAQKNTQRLSVLVDQLLELSKIESGSRKLIVQKNAPAQMIAAWSESFAYLAQQRKIDFRTKIPHKELRFRYDREVLENIIANLLGNAIKYTPQRGYVHLEVSIKDKTLCIAIKNSGRGLTSGQIKTIFNRFYQTDGQNEGVGIGLSLVKELTELHGGKINVTSKLGEWTLFEVTLCMDTSKLKNIEIRETSTTAPTITAPTIPVLDEKEGTQAPKDVHKTPKGELPILLIVEDNGDLRAMLADSLKTDYEIVQAVNGEEGVLKALEIIPDIIISDVMMPLKDGIQLTRILKNDERTSHIPIILLTAKAGDENELTGITVGADDYITKPFNQKILISKTASLISLRNKLQARYSQEVVLKPKDIAITSIDERFLERVQKILDAKLMESNFSSEQFSKAIHMSRMQLHRKLKALTGLSASEFIKSQRLKLAVQILKNSSINISEVGYSVGFNDHAYFSKCFKEAYNCTPSEFGETNKCTANHKVF